jgi:hypothetical protein
MTVTALARRRTIDDVEHDIVAAAAHINRAMYAFLVLVREYDERQGYRAWGHRSCAEWLHWRCDLGMNAARERVRVAHALAVLPQMSEALARGTLSYSKVRALTRVATPENEAALLAFAFSTTTARVEERVCQMRNANRASTAQAAKRHAERALRVFRDLNRGTMTITVEIPLEQGELVCRALDKAVQSAPEPGRSCATRPGSRARPMRSWRSPGATWQVGTAGGARPPITTRWSCTWMPRRSRAAKDARISRSRRSGA